MNDFERRLLDIVKNSSYIASVARADQRIVNIDYFSYNIRLGTTVAAIANGATVSGFAQIQADSDFVLTYIAGDVLNAAGNAINTLASALLQITDTGSGKTFFSEPTLFGMVTGRGGFPFLLPSPRVINPNTNLKVDFTNNTGGVVPGAFISFMGARVYYAG